MPIDFYVSAVRYTSDAKIEISHLRVHPTSNFVKHQPWTKGEVIISLNVRKVWHTTRLGEDNRWKTGDKLRIFVVNGESYLRTDPNDTPSDNLGNLPEF